jgi:hypothetical protein
MEESKCPTTIVLAGDDQPLPDTATVVLKVYLQREVIKCYMIDVKSVKTISLKVFRSRFGIPTKFSDMFFFAVNSLFSKKIPHDEESNFKLSEALLNFMEVVNNDTRRNRDGESKEKTFKLFLFLEPYEIAPTFQSRQEYSDCLMKLVNL